MASDLQAVARGLVLDLCADKRCGHMKAPPICTVCANAAIMDALEKVEADAYGRGCGGCNINHTDMKREAVQAERERLGKALHLQRSNDASGCETIEMFMGFNESKGIDIWHSFAKNELTDAQWEALAILADTGEAGACQECGGIVYHRDGKPGEFNHECSDTGDDDGPMYVRKDDPETGEPLFGPDTAAGEDS